MPERGARAKPDPWLAAWSRSPGLVAGQGSHAGHRGKARAQLLLPLASGGGALGLLAGPPSNSAQA